MSPWLTSIWLALDLCLLTSLSYRYRRSIYMHLWSKLLLFFFGIFLMNSLNWYGYWVCVIVKMLEVFLASVFLFFCDLSGQMRKKKHIYVDFHSIYICFGIFLHLCYICISICICMCVFRNNFKCISCLVYDFICYFIHKFSVGFGFSIIIFGILFACSQVLVLNFSVCIRACV